MNELKEKDKKSHADKTSAVASKSNPSQNNHPAPTEISAEIQLKRLLYMSNYFAFFTSNPEKHLSIINHHAIATLIENEEQFNLFSKTVEKAAEDPLLIRRFNIFHVLAHALLLAPDGTRPKVKELILKLIKSDDDFFTLIKYYTLAHAAPSKIDKKLKKLIIAYYTNKKPSDWLQSVLSHEKMHGWSHKDLIKLTHFKATNSEIAFIIKYILFGLKQLPEKGNSDFENKVIDKLNKKHKMLTTNNREEAAELLKELKLSPVNCAHGVIMRQADEVWAAGVQFMTPREILKRLSKFYELSLLKLGSDTNAAILDVLVDRNMLKEHRVHPVEIFIYLKVFEKGGKGMHPSLLDYFMGLDQGEKRYEKKIATNMPRCMPFIKLLRKCTTYAYSNVKASNKRILFTINTDLDNDKVCYHNEQIRVKEAIFSLISFYARTERQRTIVAMYKNKQIVEIQKSILLIQTELFELWKANKAEYIIPYAPINWASNQNKCIDVFVNFISWDWRSKLPAKVACNNVYFKGALEEYANKFKLSVPNAKVVNIYLHSDQKEFHIEKCENIITIFGFSPEVPHILDAFIKGSFS